MKRTIPLMITAVGGFVIIAAYFIPPAHGWAETVSIWFDILASIAFFLGAGNLLRSHLQAVSDRKSGWAYSVIVLVSFVVTLVVGLGKIGAHPAEQFPTYAWSGDYRQIGSGFWFLFEYGYTPLVATMFAMLAFYVASASFRAFRAKNFEAFLLLGTAFVILLGRTFAGVALTSWIDPKKWPGFKYFTGLKIENLTVFIMSVFNTAGTRAIMIGIALGIVAASLKLLLAIDRSYLGDD